MNLGSSTAAELPRSSTQNRFVEKNKLISLPRIQKTQHKLSIGGMRAPNFGLQCAFAASKIGWKVAHLPPEFCCRGLYIILLHSDSTQSVQFLTCLSKAFASKAYINEAVHGWDGPLASCLSLLLCLAHRFGIIQLLCWAIIDVWPVRHHDWRLCMEKHLCWLYPRLPHPRPDLDAVIIGRDSIEVPTMPILVGLLVHVDLHIHVVTLRRFHPTVDLNLQTLWASIFEFDVHDVERFARPASLQELPNIVVMHVNEPGN